MARCVPYTPLRLRGARDPVADAMAAVAAAADKLQKERKMMQKKEKKERKEKKRQKKAAQLGEKYEVSYDHSKHGHRKRKHESQNIVALETRKDLKDTVEQMEKSGLSEEHEAPSSSPALDGTPESSLDSNKRRRATVSPSPSQQRNGAFHVKLASTERGGPESTPVLSEERRALGQQAVKQMGLDLSMAKSRSDFQPHSNTPSVAKQLVASELKMAVRNGNQPTESRQVNHQQPANATQRVNMVPRASPQPTRKVMQRVDPPPTKVLPRVESAPVKVMQRAGQPMPLEVFQRDAPQVPANMLRKPTAVAAPPGQQLNVKLPAMLHKPKTFVEPPVVKQLQQMEALPKDDLCSVRTSVASIPQQKMARNGNQLGESRQINQQQPAMVMQRVNMLPRDNPRPTPKVLQRVNPPSRKVLQRANLLCANVMQKPDHLMPSKVFETGTPQVPTDVAKNATTDAPLEWASVEQPALLHRPKVYVEAPVVKEQQQIDALPKDIPTTVRASIAAAPAKEVKQSSSDRKNRKAEKKERENRKAEKKERENRKAEQKEREFADLFVTWKPSPIQTEDMDIDDQDWLFRFGATPRSDCGTFNRSTRCQPTKQLFSMQPRAVHLPDLHVYQLPYVVPF